MTPTSNVRIWWDASVSAYRLTSPYNKDFIEALKLLIPASDRAIDMSTKIWTFTEKWLEPTVKLVTDVTRLKPQVVTRSQVEQASTGAHGAQKTVSIDVVLVQFMRLLPYEAAQKSYRHAALLLHPDRGGDMQKMSSLNIAWERIQKEVYNQ